MDPELARFLREELGADFAPAGGEWQVTTDVKVWRGSGGADAASTIAWHYLAITDDVAASLRAASSGRTAAWGSVSVEVTIGATSWRTSAFPSKDLGGYFLPLKQAVRKKERLAEGDRVTATLRI